MSDQDKKINQDLPAQNEGEEMGTKPASEQEAEKAAAQEAPDQKEAQAAPVEDPGSQAETTPVEESPAGQEIQAAPAEESAPQTQPASEAEHKVQDELGLATPPKRSKAPIIVAAAAALVIIVAAVVIFSGGGSRPGVIDGVSRTDNPEAYLQKSLALSGLDAQGSYMEAMIEFSPFNLERFSGRPVEHRLAVNVDELYDFWGPSEFMGANGEIRIAVDEEAGNALMGVDIGMSGLTFKDNQLFISEDMIALSIPDLYTRHQYISINPGTFFRDWAGSELGAMFPLSPSDIAEFESMLPMLTSMVELFDASAMEAFMEAYYAQIVKMSDALMTSGTFLDEGDVEITVSDRTFTAAKLGYHVSEEAMNALMQEFMEMYVEMMRAYMGGFINAVAELDGSITTDEIWDELLAAMDSIRFPDGITHYYYVDLETNLIRRMDIPNMTMLADDGFGGQHESSMDMVIELRGEQRVYDAAHYFITLTDDYDTYPIEMSMYMPEGGPYTFFMNMDMGSDGVSTLNMGYDPAAAENNLWFVLASEDQWTNGEFDIRGTVSNETDLFTIEDGRMVFAESGNRVFALGFEYGLRNVSPEEVTIDRSQAADLFSLDINQLQQDLFAAMMRMSMMM